LDIANVKEEQVVRLKNVSPIAPLVAFTGERRVDKTSLLRRIAKYAKIIIY